MKSKITKRICPECLGSGNISINIVKDTIKTLNLEMEDNMICTAEFKVKFCTNCEGDGYLVSENKIITLYVDPATLNTVRL